MDFRFSEMLQALPLLAIFSFSIKAVSGTCQPPGFDSTQFELITTAQTEYVNSDVVVFSCLSGNGHGYFKMTCESSGGSSVWSEQSRDCDDGIAFDNGSLAGILCGVFTLLVCIVLMILSTRLRRQRMKEEETELKIMETASSTKA